MRGIPLIALTIILLLGFFLHLDAIRKDAVEPIEREIRVMAKKFQYTPNIIEVNRGDRVTIKLYSEDVHHGFYLDGFDVQTSARPGEPGSLSFTANKTGKFNFRCSVTCGAMHPYMIGYLRVKPDYRFFGATWILVGLGYIALVGTGLSPKSGGKSSVSEPSDKSA